MDNIKITRTSTRTLIVHGALYQDDVVTVTSPDAIAPDVAILAGTVMGRATDSGSLAPFAASANDGTQVPVGVLTCAITASPGVDVKVRLLIKGQVRLGDLVAQDATHVFTPAELDQLRSAGVIARNTNQLSDFDNGEPTE